MRRIFTHVVTNLVVVALVMPAGIAAAAQGDSRQAATTSVTAAKTAPAPAIRAESIQSAIDRVTGPSATAKAQSSPGSPRNTKIRMQGGGGKSGMIIGIVSAVVGLAGTVYMIRYMQQQQKKNSDGSY